MEMLRIIAMLFVLVLHANFLALGPANAAEAAANPLSCGMRVFFQSLSIGAVDIFVLLSGWFGIRPKLKSFGNLVFQCLFFSVGIYAFCVCMGLAPLTKIDVAKALYIVPVVWFVPAYILLYILSPVLNVFVEHASKKQFVGVIIGFFVFQSLYAWVSFGVGFFVRGYSTISFIGLYLLARYVRLYAPGFARWSCWKDLAAFFALVALGGIGYYLSWDARFFDYTSILVIFASLYLLLFFSKLEFRNRFVNWVSGSAFAVYLIHCEPHVLPIFLKYSKEIFQEYSGMQYLAVIAAFLMAVFMASVLLDKLRMLCWKPFAAWIDSRK